LVSRCLREADDVVVMRVVAPALAALGRERKPVLEGSGAVGGRNDPAARVEQPGLIGGFSTIAHTDEAERRFRSKVIGQTDPS
jgi:hypothetical protein